MTDTTTLDQPGESAPEGDEHLETLEESDSLGADGVDSENPIKSRFLLPLLLPALSMAVVALLVLNISRVFLAGSDDGAVVIGIIITLSILVGSSIIAAQPRLKTSTLGLIIGGMLLFVSIAGLITLGPSLNEGDNAASGYVAPTGPAVGAVSVAAGPGLSFNACSSPATTPRLRASSPSTTAATPATRLRSTTRSSTASF